MPEEEKRGGRERVRDSFIVTDSEKSIVRGKFKTKAKKPKLALSYPSFSFYFSFHSVHFSALK